MKQLIVTADDVGLHRGMTEGAVRAHLEGIVTACSIVANGAAFEHATECLREVPTLAVGVHLTLVEERPLSHAPHSLVGRNGLFHESFLAFVPRYFAGVIRIDEVDRELRMQIERVLGAGLTPVHLNGHQHLHLLPKIFDLVQHLAEEYDIDYVRIVDEKAHGHAPRDAAIAALSAMGRRARRRALVATNDRTIGVRSAGRIASGADIVGLLDEIDGTTELICHPATGEDVSSAYDWGSEWEAEAAALCHPGLRGEIDGRGIELVAPPAITRP